MPQGFRFPVHKDIQSIALSHPIPGQSFTRKPQGDPWQTPPQFTKLDEALEYLFDRLTQPFYLKNLLHLFELNASVESIARTILFTGFTQGKWTPTLMMLLYKPVLMLVAVLAHKAGYSHIPMIEPKAHQDYHSSQIELHQMANEVQLGRQAKDQKAKNMRDQLDKGQPVTPDVQPKKGFATKPGGM